nr:MAG TPA: hypothetical protein [Caudoviricetes sp.]
MLHLFLFDTAKIRIYFYCAIKYITFSLFDVVKLFLIEKTKKKTKKTQRKYKHYTNHYRAYLQVLAYLCI